MPERITSVHNSRIKAAARLRHRDERELQDRTIIDGAREISRAMNAGVELVELFVCEEALSDGAHFVAQNAAKLGIPRYDVSPAVLSKVGFGERNEGIVAITRPIRLALADLDLPDDALVAVLANVEKPGNVGAVVRTADAAGASAVIVANGATDVFNPNAIRTSLGSIFTLPVVATSDRETLEWLRAMRFNIFAARVDDSRSYTDAALTKRTALVLGNEAQGLQGTWSAPDITPISLPMIGAADSLNVSVTAGILLYEALRQRRAPP